MKLRMRGPLVTGFVLLLSIAGILFLVTMDHDKLYDDPKALAGSANSYSAVMFVNRQTNGGYSGSVGKLSGIHEVFSLYKREETSVTLRCSLEVTVGKAKLVWADPQGNVTTLLEGHAGESDSVTVTLTLPEGANRLKVAGADKAACAWEVEVKEGQ